MGVLDKLAGGSHTQQGKGIKAPKAPARPDAKPVIRDALGRVVPGSGSPNPGGKPKGLEAGLRELLKRARGDELLEGIIAGEVILPNGEVIQVRDLRLRMESYRWAYERANGKALERSVSLNADLPGGEAALALDNLPEDTLGALLKASAGVLNPAPAGQLPPGVVEGELVPEAPEQASDLPNTDPAKPVDPNQ